MKEDEIHMAERDDDALWFKLDELVWSCAISQAVHVAVELGIPELLQAGRKSAGQLAATTSSDEATLESILFALAAFDVLDMDDSEHFSLTELGTLLLKSKPGIPEEAGVFFETIYKPLGSLLASAQTGETAFEHVFKMTFYEYLSRNPSVGRFFNEQMIRNAPTRYGALSSLYDFSRIEKIVDVGGGQGGLLLQLLAQQPHLTATLLDLPNVVQNAHERIEAAGLSDRCRIVGGNFLESVPSGGDLYILAAVVNNLRDDNAVRLLKNCRAAMGINGKLLILEALRKFGERPSRWAALVRLGIAAQRGAYRSRTETRYRELLENGGFELSKIEYRQSEPRTVIEATPA